jgi:hypothetical protein
LILFSFDLFYFNPLPLLKNNLPHLPNTIFSNSNFFLLFPTLFLISQYLNFYPPFSIILSKNLFEILSKNFCLNKTQFSIFPHFQKNSYLIYSIKPINFFLKISTLSHSQDSKNPQNPFSISNSKPSPNTSLKNYYYFHSNLFLDLSKLTYMNIILQFPLQSHSIYYPS